MSKHSTLNAMDHWHNVQSTVSGHCKGWESEARAKDRHRRPYAKRGEPAPRQPTGLNAVQWAPATYRRETMRWELHCNPDMTAEEQADLEAWLLTYHPDR